MGEVNKTVKLNADQAKNTQTEKPQTKKLSYEELEQVASQLSEQSRQLYEKLKKQSLENMFMRLNYLFKVVENKDVFSKEFKENCIKEIEDVMTIPESTEGSDKDVDEDTESK